MRIMTRCTSVLALVMAIVAVSAMGAGTLEPEHLKWSWNVGDVATYRLTVRNDAVMSGNVPGMNADGMKMQSTQSFQWDQMVREVTEDGVATIEATYQRVRMDMDMPGMGKIRYDSDRPEESTTDEDTELGVVGEQMEDMMVKPLEGLLGETFTYELAPTGKVLSVSGYDKIMQKMFESMEENPMGPAMADAFGEQLSNDSMKQQLEQMMHVLPEGPVEVSDSWNVNLRQSMPFIGKMNYDATYVLVGHEHFITDDCARLAVKSTWNFEEDTDFKPDADSDAAQMMQMFDMDIQEASARGDVHFSTERGVLMRTVQDIHMVMVMSMKQQEGQPSFDFEMKQDMKMQMTLEKVEDNTP